MIQCVAAKQTRDIPGLLAICNLQSAIRNPQSKPQPLQGVGRRIAGRGNLFLGLEAAHGFDGGLVVCAGQFADVEAPLLERFLNLESARAVDFEGLVPRGRDGVIV